MPVKFVRQNSCYDIHEKIACDSTKLEIKYDGSGRRISKTRVMKTAADGDWYVDNVTHYTGIGTEVRETHVNGQDETKVVVNLPNGLGRYMPEDASAVDIGFGAGYIPSEKFEWYLKNHLGSTMLVYGTQWVDDENLADVGAPLAAYDYRAFGEQVDLAMPTDKVTENFTGKERDDETALNYFGARYLDPMLGLWTSVDPARQFASPYLYAGNGYNPVVAVDEDGNDLQSDLALSCQQNAMETTAKGAAFYVTGILTGMEAVGLVGSVGTVLGAAATMHPEALAAVPKMISSASARVAAATAPIAAKIASYATPVISKAKDVYEKAQIFVGEKYEQIGKIGDFISGALGGPGPVTSTTRGGTIEGGAALMRGIWDTRDDISNAVDK